MRQNCRYRTYVRVGRKDRLMQGCIICVRQPSDYNNEANLDVPLMLAPELMLYIVENAALV